jgi:hypothetical protein
MASAIRSIVPATISWLAAFTVCPEPGGPTSTTVVPITADERDSGHGRVTFCWRSQRRLSIVVVVGMYSRPT